MFAPTGHIFSFVLKLKLQGSLGGFRGPHCKENSQQICLSLKHIVDSNLLLMCNDYQSFKVVTENPKLVFLNTYKVATHYKNQFQFK